MPGNTPETATLTLDPLRTDGPAALDTHQAPGISRITLHEIEVATENANHEVLIIRSHDLFDNHRATDHSREPIPATGKLARATLHFQFQDADRPHAVDIRPPTTLKFQFPADAERILPWLDKSRFRIPKALANALAILILAIATALAPTFDDDDADDDDTDSDRHALCT